MTERYNFNGMSNRLEVLTSIKENIQDGDTDTAIDMINQMIELEPQPEKAKPVADALDHHQIMQKGIVR
tara:strand:+ start:252 stop:458 length:207 start_codon:yes stop_codon:yes gene_type:complete